MPEPTHFIEVLKGEVVAVNRRRDFVSDGRLTDIEVVDLPDKSDIHSIPPLHSEHDIVGLACSGGGVRSSAFCLGVFQGLDSINPNNEEPQVLHAVDYLSTVSGGGYIGASVAAGLMQTQGRFPFESKLDDQETLKTKHLRDYSNYLKPGGFFDIVVGLSAVLRALVVNAMIFLGIILLLAAGTVCYFTTEDVVHRTHYFGWTTVGFFAILMISQIVYALTLRPGIPRLLKLTGRERVGWLFAFALSLCAIFTFFELQPYVLAGLFDARHLRVDSNHQANWLGRTLHGPHNTQLETIWASLIAAAILLIVFGNKLTAVATATRGDQTWVGFLKHWASRFAVYAAAVVVPLLLWFTYLAFSYWGIDWVNANPADVPSRVPDVPPHPPTWLTYLSHRSWLPLQPSAWLTYLSHLPSQLLAWLLSLLEALRTLRPISKLYFIAAIVLIGLSLFITPNANSMHSYYRDRLSRAFLWNLAELEKAANASPVSFTERFSRRWKAIFRRWNAIFRKIKDDPDQCPIDDPDQCKLSSLKPMEVSKPDKVGFAPYLLINTAVNLEGSEYLNQRGRNADSFFFSPLYVGSEATGYSPTSALESIDKHVNLATAMAISGAAASANMGASTIRALTFSLAALNVRLGYWLPNPRYLKDWGIGRRLLANIGPWYFAKETLGLLNEKAKMVYLTDGGGFDNLGIYELLRRRCKVIIAADAEADPPLNCDSLIRLQKYARIDLGVRIDLPWEDIRRSNTKITVECPHGPLDDPAQCCGPHVAIGRINYDIDKKEYGVLIYIKASMSGDESDLIRDYRRRYPNFPHETTLDQFFGEEQFEVYRALGFHATRKFFLGEDLAAMLKTSPVKGWPKLVKRALIRLNIPKSAIALIVERQRDELAREYGVSKFLNYIKRRYHTRYGRRSAG